MAVLTANKEVVYTRSDICGLCGISNGYLTQLIQAGRVRKPTVQIGLRFFYSEAEKDGVLKDIANRAESR